MKATKSVRVILFFFLIFSLCVPLPVYGKQGDSTSSNSSACDTAQFILLVDLSNSMLRNDPTDLRFTGSLHVADVLASNYLSARLVSTRLNRPKKLELAVVQFASSARVALDWTSISPTDYDAWQEQRAAIADAVAPGRAGEAEIKEEISNGTNHKRAFQILVNDLFSEKDPPVDGCPQRTVILMTDGLPDKQGEPYRDDDLDAYMLGKPTENGREGDGLISLVKDNLYSTGDRTYVIAINDSNDSYWRFAEHYWQAITCDVNRKNPESNFWAQIECDQSSWDTQEPARAERVNNPSELGLRLDKIVSYRLGSGLLTIKPGAVTMPPYLDRVVFNFYKPDIENQIDLMDPQGQLLSCNDSNILCQGVGEGIQTLQVLRPSPGKYIVSTNSKSDEYVITRELIFAQGSLATPDQNYQQFTTSSLKINLVDSEGKALPSYGDKYRLLVDATVTPPPASGAEPYPISLIDTGKSSLEGTFTPLYGGVNHLSIRASVTDDEGQKWDVIQTPFADFDLLVDPVSIMVEAPVSERAAAGCGLVQFMPFELPVRIINSQTNQIATPNVEVKLDLDVPDGMTLGGQSNGNSNTVFNLIGWSNKSGDQTVRISAGVSDPQNANNLITFDIRDVSLRFMPGRLLKFSELQLEPSADVVTVSLENLSRSWFGGKESEYLIVGRRFFFLQPGVEIIANFEDQNSENKDPVSAQQVPLLSFVPEKTGDPVQAGKWEAVDGSFRSYTEGLELGYYSVQVDKTSPVCDVTLETSVVSGSSLYLVPGLSERIILGVLLAAFVALLLFLGGVVICRFTNPLSGYLAILPANGKKSNWYNGIFGWSCWWFKIHEPTENGLVTRISVRGALRKKGTFTLRYYLMRGSDGKKGFYEDVQCDLNNWSDIPLVTGFKIIWRRTDSEFPH